MGDLLAVPSLAAGLAALAACCAGRLLGGSCPLPSGGRAPQRWRALLLGLVAVALVLAGSVRAGPLLVGWAAVAGIVGTGGIVLLRRARDAAAVRQGADQVLAACEGLVADLEAGAPVQEALGEAAVTCPALAPVARASALGADVVLALRSAATGPGCAQLRLVAATWAVSHRAGEGLAASLRATARTLRAAEATRRVVIAELASARATARLMAMLPMFTWLLALGTGAHPLRFLLGTGAGLCCAALGSVLALLGVGWIDQLARRVERGL